jgi:hypothetical protein
MALYCRNVDMVIAYTSQFIVSDGIYTFSFLTFVVNIVNIIYPYTIIAYVLLSQMIASLYGRTWFSELCIVM